VGLAQFNLELPVSLPSAATANGSIRMRIGDPTTGQTFNLYLATTETPSTVSYTNQRVSTQAPPANLACVVPPAVPSFVTNNQTVYLYFEATTTANDALTDQWIAPDGSVLQPGSWTPSAGDDCYFDSFNISNLPASQLGSWSAQVYDNGTPLFSVPFTVSAGPGTTVLVSSSGQNVVNGRDASYQIIADTTGEIPAPASAFVVTLLAGGWASIPGAAWIGPSADQSNATRNPCCLNTADTYRTTVSVTGDPSAVTLSLTVAADDYVDILLNGQQVFTHTSTSMWGTPVSFSISSGFVSGTNDLDFAVTNGGGPTGLIVAVTAKVSEN